MWPFKRRHHCKHWTETQCRRFVPYIPISLTAPKRKLEQMTTHLLKATFYDGETLEHAFAAGDVIVLGYATDPYKRTVPLFEGGAQLATVEIRTSDPRLPSPTFEVVKKPTSVIPTDCRDSCAIAHSVAAMQAELAAARSRSTR